VTLSSDSGQAPQWGDSYRLIAAEKWRAKSAQMGKEVTAELVRLANPAPGEKVLDVATGTGEPAISLAGAVGPNGHVTALDLSKELLALASQRAQARGLTNFTVQQGDAHQLPFADGSFDLVTCRFGVMFFADLPKALRELHRVLRPGGRACFAAWGRFEQPYWQSTMGVVHRHVGGPLLAEGAENMFLFGDPGTLSAALKSAGFNTADEQLQTLPWGWAGPVEEVWEYAQSMSTPFKALLQRIPAGRKQQIEDEVCRAIGEFARGDRVDFSVQVVMAVARRK
jgi:ubiquinone/menaquinone biosynthesis C-methylase UbiE